MDDGWRNVRTDLFRKKLISRKRRRLELLVRSDAIKEMYHSLVENVVELYKDNRNDLHSWEHFRNAATKLTEMHRFVKLTVSRFFEIGAAEGAAVYSQAFFEKLNDFWTCSHNQNIPLNFLQDYLSQPNDPLPKPVRRTKRLAYRRLVSRNPRDRLAIVSQPSPSSVAIANSDPAAHNTSSTYFLSENILNLPSNDAPLGTPPVDSLSYSSEDSPDSTSSCSCGECATDTTSSTTDDDDVGPRACPVNPVIP